MLRGISQSTLGLARHSIPLLSRHILVPQKCYSSSTTIPQRHFKPLDGQVDTGTDAYKTNAAASTQLAGKYRSFLALIQDGGGEKARVRHTESNKKKLVADRLKLLFDDPDDVLELGAFSGLGMKYGNVPRAGLLVAIGRINGVYCMVSANDATVKGGTLFPIGVKKSVRCQEIAQQNRIPVIYVVDSGGAFLPLQAEIFNPGGRGFYNEAVLNAMNVPQLAVVVGSCTAGAAYIPTMSQEALIVHRIGTIFLGGPPLVYAALGEVVTPEKLGGGQMHSSVSGCTDYFAETEEEAFSTSRDVVATFNIPPVVSPHNVEEPLFEPTELAGIIPSKDQHKMDIKKVIARVVDGSRFHEFKALYGPTLVTGFAYIQGQIVGIIANEGEMTRTAALKAAHFVQLSTQRQIPLIFLQNSAPSASSSSSLSTAAEIEEANERICAHAKLMSAVACSPVPKITVIVGNSLGADNFMMCGRSFNPNFIFSWPNAKTCMVDPDSLVDTLMEDKYPDPEKQEESFSKEYQEYRAQIEEQVAVQSSSFNASAQLWDDGIIMPEETRKVVGRCLEIIKQSSHVPNAPMEYGVMRM